MATRSRTKAAPAPASAAPLPAPHFRGNVEYEYDDDGALVLRDWEGSTIGIECQVDISGDDAALYQWNHAEERFIRIDRLRDVTVLQTGSFVEIRGASEKFHSSPLRRSLSPERNIVTLRLFPTGCQDCD